MTMGLKPRNQTEAPRRRRSGVRRPRNLAQYTSKEQALAFLDQMRRQVEREPDRIRLKLHLQYNRWDSEWEWEKAP